MEKVEEILNSIVGEVPGATMATLFGVDGVGVQAALGDAWESMGAEALDVELASLASAVQRAAERLGAGASPEFFLGTARADFVGTMLDDPYFLVLGLEPGSDLDGAREALAQAREVLAESGLF